jgi:hypothetical protein
MMHLTCCYCLVFAIYLFSNYLFSYLPIYILDLFVTKLVTKVKSNIKSVKVHPQLSNNGHPMDCPLVGVGSPWLVQAFDTKKISYMYYFDMCTCHIILKYD